MNNSISIPILYQFCDYTDCNYNYYYYKNYDTYQLIPTFAFAAIFSQYNNINPSYPNKINQIIWRGALTYCNHMKRKYNESQYDLRCQILKLIYSNIITNNNNTLQNI